MVGTAPGGINDITARFVARHLGQYIPGNPAIVVQNQPGAGGIASANRLYNTFERDGSVIVKLERAVPDARHSGRPGASISIRLKINWLGSLSSYAGGFLSDAGDGDPIRCESVDELKAPGKKAITLGGDNAASSNLIFSHHRQRHSRIEHQGGCAAMSARHRCFLPCRSGEIDGQIIGYSSVRTGQRDLWSHHAFRPLLQFGRSTRLADFPEVPTRQRTDQGPERAVRCSTSPTCNLPFRCRSRRRPACRRIARKRCGRASWQCARTRPCGEEAEKLGIEKSPIDGDTVVKSIARAAATPREVIARYNGLVGLDRN